MDATEACARAQELIGYQFRDPDLLIRALTHSSIANTRLESNERMEFLGDAVLGLVVCEELFRRFDEWLEGDLTKLKSVLVSRRMCAQIADETGLTNHLLLGNGIDHRGPLPTSLRAAVVESLIGAVFLDGGLEPSRAFILRALGPHIDTYGASDHHDNHKSALQQFVQRHLDATPRYETLDEQGPDHSKCFEICVVIDDRRYPSAWGASKKQAEQEAARKALETLQVAHGFADSSASG